MNRIPTSIRRLTAIATHPRTASRGLTMIELIVVVGIVAVVSAVVAFNYSDFSTNVSVRTLAQEVALSIRKAQSYATSVQSIAGGSSTSYPAYGIAFSLASVSSDPAVPSQKRFVLFADVDGNGRYDNGSGCGTPTAGNECLEGFGITTSDSIMQICSDVLGSCYGTGSNGSVTMIFTRPSPDAVICVNQGGTPDCSAPNAEIVVRSVKGVTQHIRLWNTGQISVQ